MVPGVDQVFEAEEKEVTTVGASLLAKVVNDDAGCLEPRGVLRFFASKLAPTGCGSLSPG
ncbi:hypothetical protein C7A11_12265 [Pseudomonas simiae]|nr:hypothetical protein C7A11_12265 [Pseudomonas simiae]